MEQAEALAAQIDLIPLAQWRESRGISRNASFTLLRVAGIETHKVRTPGSRAPVAALDQEQVTALDALVARLQAGESLASLEAAATSALATIPDRPGPSEDALGLSGTVPDEVHDAMAAAALLRRLEAADLAIRTGLPLSTAEARWILGARPGADRVTRGRLTATRHSRGVWSLSVESPGSFQTVRD